MPEQLKEDPIEIFTPMEQEGRGARSASREGRRRRRDDDPVMKLLTSMNKKLDDNHNTVTGRLEGLENTHNDLERRMQALEGGQPAPARAEEAEERPRPAAKPAASSSKGKGKDKGQPSASATTTRDDTPWWYLPMTQRNIVTVGGFPQNSLNDDVEATLAAFLNRSRTVGVINQRAQYLYGSTAHVMFNTSHNAKLFIEHVRYVKPTTLECGTGHTGDLWAQVIKTYDERLRSKMLMRVVGI